MKYVRHSTAGFFLFTPDTPVYHAHVGKLASAMAPGRIISAGFCTLAGGVRCFGRSESLDLGPVPDDAAALARQLGLDTDSEGGHHD